MPETEQNVELFLKYSVEDDFNDDDDDDDYYYDDDDDDDDDDGDFGQDDSRNRVFNCFLFMKQYLFTFTFLSFITLFTDALKAVLSLYTFSMDGARVGLARILFCWINKRIITQDTNILTKDMHVSNSIDDMWSTMKGKLWPQKK